MVGTALLIAAATVIVGLCVLALGARHRRRLDRARSAPDGAVRERAEALRQISRDRDRESASRVTLDAFSSFGQ
jgi:hypothetical protein